MTILPLGSGKCSTFGGPSDGGVGPREGLALVQPSDLNENWFRRVFLRVLDNSLGLARNLDPDAFYIAMRWNEVGIDPSAAKRGIFIIEFSGKHAFAQAVDYGPGDGKVVDGVQDPDTGRLVDLSPGLASALGANTDDIVTVSAVA